MEIPDPDKLDYYLCCKTQLGMEPFKDDDDLLGYLWAHCRTPLGLVHKDHLKRLFELAEVDPPEDLGWRSWWNTSREVIDPLVQQARNLKTVRAVMEA